MKLSFNKNYFLSFLLLLIIEVAIALYAHDNFIRPFFGDFLVVFLIYCFMMSFVKWNKYKIAIGVLVFSFTIEFLQFVNIISIIGLEKSKVASTVIGTSFSVEDLVIYFLAFLSIIGFEYILDKKTRA